MRHSTFQLSSGVRWSLIALTIAAVIAVVRAAPESNETSDSAAPPPPAPNPHWRADGCRHCHTYDNGELKRIPIDEGDRSCWTCHDGQRAPMEAHPVGRTFDNDQVTRPEGWPAPDGKLGCITCHDVLQACEHPGQCPSANPAFLRLDPGENMLQFCGKCHVQVEGTVGRFNPHVMLDEQGNVMPHACRFCHTTSFQAEKASMTRTGSAQLRQDPITLCITCHPRHIDYFEPGHIGHPVNETILSNMLASDRRAGLRDETATTQPATTQPARLPLTEDNRIVCSTCHNPHQRGVFPEGSVLSLGATTPSSDPHRLELRGLGKGVCHACHR